MTWSVCSRVARAAFVALATVVAGCTEAPTTPRPSARTLQPPLDVSAGARAPRWHPNAVKYRDRGHKPATSRSGSASLELRALMGKDHLTAVEVTTGRFESDAPPPGTLEKVQLKTFNPAGEQLTTRNAKPQSGGYAKYEVANLVRGSGVQVQANVSGIEASRTDVVTVRDQVYMRPDLAITNVEAPFVVLVDATVNIVAHFRELNGDVGARANCVLSVNGTPVGAAVDVWVDAAGFVSCAFTTRFSRAERALFAVELTGVEPGDYDTSNNRRDMEIVVADRLAGFSFFVNVSESIQTASWRISSEQTYGPDDQGITASFRSSQYTSRMDLHQQNGTIGGWLPYALSFPFIGVSIAHVTNGSTLFAESFDLPAEGPVEPGAGESCGLRFEQLADNLGVAFLLVCSGVREVGDEQYPYTFFQQTRFVSEITYFVSVGEAESHDPRQQPPDQFWTFNSNIDQPPTIPPLGDTYRIRLELPFGNSVYVADGSVELTPFHVEFPNMPWTCTSFVDGFLRGQNCEERWGQSETGRRGVMESVGTLETRMPALTP